jgi:hypothetical protein
MPLVSAVGHYNRSFQVVPFGLAIISIVRVVTIFARIFNVALFGAVRIIRFTNKLVSQMRLVIILVCNMANFAFESGETHCGAGGRSGIAPIIVTSGGLIIAFIRITAMTGIFRIACIGTGW